MKLTKEQAKEKYPQAFFFCDEIYIAEICNIDGGDFHGGNFYNGDFHGGNFYGGDFYGGDFYGGDFHGGDFYGGDFYGGVFSDGYFYGGNFRDGNFRGGEFHGGEIHGGDFNKSPLQIQGTKDFFLCYKIEEQIVCSIGCYSFPLHYWLENSQQIGKSQGYTVEEINEYKEYLLLAEKLVK